MKLIQKFNNSKSVLKKIRKKILIYRKNNYKPLKYYLLKNILKKFNLIKKKKLEHIFQLIMKLIV